MTGGNQRLSLGVRAQGSLSDNKETSNPLQLLVQAFCKPRKYPYPGYPSIQQATKKWGGMGKLGGNGGEMGANGAKWEIVTRTSWKMYENVPTRKKNGGKWGGKWGGTWVKNGTRSGNFCIFPGPISPFFPKGPISRQGHS